MINPGFFFWNSYELNVVQIGYYNKVNPFLFLYPEKDLPRRGKNIETFITALNFQETIKIYSYHIAITREKIKELSR